MTKREALAQIDTVLAGVFMRTTFYASLAIARDALAREIATAEAVEPDLRHDDYDGDPERDDEGEDV